MINQIEAGVDLIQIFDTHSYQMDNTMHKKYSIEQVKKISKAIKKKYPDIPIIYYSKNYQFLDNDINQYINCLTFHTSRHDK